jgi:hypothetical protein
MHDSGRGEMYYILVMRDLQNKDTTTYIGANKEEERTVRRVLIDQPKDGRPYDEISDLIGSVKGLPADLSKGTDARFAEIVQQKAGRRR